MASSILRWIFGKAAANSPIFSLLRGLMDPVNNSALVRGLIDRVNNSALVRGLMEPATSSKTSPWLMIPPTFEGNIMVFNFYSFQDKTVKKFIRERVGILGSDDIKFVSSSHGWLALFNRRNCDLVLFNPLSGRQIKLPPFHTLDMDRVNLKLGHWCVTKVITSCSPEEEDCRVLMSFGPHLRLAFCSPSSKTDWTPIGLLYYKDDRGDNPLILRRNYEAEGENHPIFNGNHKAKGQDKPILRGYHDFVYSGRENIFYCIDTHMGFEYWDLQDTGYPKTRELDPSLDLDTYPWPIRPQEEFELLTNFKSLSFLVVEEGSRDIFWVIRHIMPHMDLDGSYANSNQRYKFPHKYPYKTIGFDVHKYDREKDALVYMDGSLGGLSLFIGNNHSFAISDASEYPELKPNSIYFTDVNELIPEEGLFGGHDLGIYNYGNKSFSSTCYYPCDRQNIKRIIPSPMWFTPKY